MMKKTCATTSSGGILTRKIDEGSFVGLKKMNTPEELVEWLKHVRAYRWASKFIKGKNVLDIGCSIGYGAYEFSTKATAVVGIDLWKEGLSYCHQNYKAVSPLMSSGIKLPFKDNSFDLVVSFQVIEHIAPKEVVTYLHEIKRVLRPDGTFTVTTPNKLLRLLPFQKPWSSGHKKEYDAKELETLLANVFGNVKIFGLFATKDAYLTEYKRVKQSPLHVYFFNPLGLMMSKVLSKSLMAKLKIVVHAKETNSSNQYSTIANFKLDDFQLSQENLNNSLDLYGICTNTGAIES